MILVLVWVLVHSVACFGLVHFNVSDEAQVEDAVEEGAQLGRRAPVVGERAVAEDEPVARPLLPRPAREPALLGAGLARALVLVQHLTNSWLVL